MATIVTIQVHETFHIKHGDKPRHTFPDPQNYLQPVPLVCLPANAALHLNNSTICVPLQLIWHHNHHGPLHVTAAALGKTRPNVDALIIAAIRTEFGITISPGQENLVFVCNHSFDPLHKPVDYNDIDSRPGSILVVHLLPKMVQFTIDNVYNANQHVYQFRVQISPHNYLLEIKHAIHKALGLTPGWTVEFQDRSRNTIHPN